MKKVALVGFSKASNQPAYSLPDDVEVWTLNHAHNLEFPRVDRWFDVHRWELIQDPNFLVKDYQQGHQEWLQQEHDFPIYMVDKYDEIPASVRLPFESLWPLKGNNRTFTSSFDWMIAMAILEGYDRIEVYGFDMAMDTEYEYQRESAVKWVNFAEGLGINVYITPESGLHSQVNLIYGYEGIPMVGRQTIETHIKQYEREEAKSEAEMNKWLGVMSERRHSSRRKRSEAQEMVNGYMRQKAMNEGARKALEFLLKKCDMVELEPILTDEYLATLEG